MGIIEKIKQIEAEMAQTQKNKATDNAKFALSMCPHRALCALWRYAFIFGKIGQAPVQKILRNGKSVTIFTVGTGGMFDQRL
ncbi:hypothetical protein Syun_009290 [Stephania yunnanensis]|uniref:Uncharacterized protein n=1 Tax=Stephania yunnanensis TaxID=152371 RepID=A0AAP0KE54_9MAGN